MEGYLRPVGYPEKKGGGLEDKVTQPRKEGRESGIGISKKASQAE